MHRARSSEMRERLTETGRSTPVQHPRDPMHDLFVTIGRGSRFAANSLLPNGIPVSYTHLTLPTTSRV